MTVEKQPKAGAAPGRGRSAQLAPTKPDDNGALLQLLTRLTESVEKLAQPSQGPGSSPTPEEKERATVLFAYDFLGLVLGRPNFPAPVDVERNGNELTFRDLRNGAGTFALLRAADNTREELAGLVENTPVELKVIPNDQAIDSIVIFTEKDGVPLAVAECQPAESNVDVG